MPVSVSTGRPGACAHATAALEISSALPIHVALVTTLHIREVFIVPPPASIRSQPPGRARRLGPTHRNGGASPRDVAGRDRMGDRNYLRRRVLTGELRVDAQGGGGVRAASGLHVRGARF